MHENVISQIAVLAGEGAGAANEGYEPGIRRNARRERIHIDLRARRGLTDQQRGARRAVTKKHVTMGVTIGAHQVGRARGKNHDLPVKTDFGFVTRTITESAAAGHADGFGRSARKVSY